VHVPAIKQTHNLINAEALARFKPGARLLNFARAEIVDVDAVVGALDKGTLAAYITDFPVPALLGRKNALLFPHIGASTEEAEDNCSVMAAEQLMDFLENGNITNSVNYPQTRMARDGGYRITFANSNVPRVLGQVLSVLADHNINVIDMVNKSMGDMAYNIIDVESEPTAEILQAIAAAEGVRHVRVV
jgi:D-3-phosphoglycerate dehydrogenase